MSIHQGDCVNLDRDENTYQVIGMDGDHDSCWLSRWPIKPQGGSQVFEISLNQIRNLGGRDVQ